MDINNDFGSILQKANPQGDRSWPNFAMPALLQRGNFNFESKIEEYFISEKSDGVRFFVFVEEENVFFQDRAKSTFTPRSDSMKKVLIESFCNSVFDVEVVNASMKNSKEVVQLISVFDALKLNGEDIAAMEFQQRYKLLQKAFTSKGIFNHKEIQEKVFLKLKTFVESKHFQQISQKFDHNSMTYCDDIFSYQIDGLIFQLSSIHYHFNFSQEYAYFPIYKWKYTNKLTIDVKLTKLSDKDIFTVKDRKKEIELPLVFFPKDENEKSEILHFVKMNQNRSVILELGLEQNCWVLKRIRNDKTDANNVRSVIDTLKAMRNNYHIQEIESLMSKSEATRLLGFLFQNCQLNNQMQPHQHYQQPFQQHHQPQGQQYQQTQGQQYQQTYPYKPRQYQPRHQLQQPHQPQEQQPRSQYKKQHRQQYQTQQYQQQQYQPQEQQQYQQYQQQYQ